MIDQLDEKGFLDPAKWIKHPDVQLDHDVAEFTFVMMDWVRRCRARRELAHYTEAPQPLEWPDLPTRNMLPLPLRALSPKQRAAGCPFSSGSARCGSSVTRRLLATGRYADQEPPAPAAVTDECSRKLRPRGTTPQKRKKQGSDDSEAVALEVATTRGSER